MQEVIRYEALDGTIFATPEECKKHECQCGIDTTEYELAQILDQIAGVAPNARLDLFLKMERQIAMLVSTRHTGRDNLTALEAPKLEGNKKKS